MDLKTVYFRIGSVLLFITLSTTTVLCQEIERLKVTHKGIAPITFRIDNVKANDIFAGAMELIKAYCSGLCSISSEENKSIQVEAVQQNAFTLTEQGRWAAFDIKLFLMIKIADGQINIEYRVGAFSKHGQDQQSKLTYLDLFDKDGAIKERYVQSCKELETSINVLPIGIYEHIRKNYVPQLVSNDYSRGYLKGNAKYSVWQYFNSNKQVELVINHTAGKIMYQIPDSTSYIVFKDGGWSNSKLDIRPMPTNGFHEFYSSVNDELPYRGYLKCPSVGNKIASVIFEVDTLGKAVNWAIKNGIDSSCDSTILSAFQSASKSWIPGVQRKKHFKTRLVIPLVIDSVTNKNDSKDEIQLVLKDVNATPLQTYFLEIPKKDDRIFTFVEKSAEPVGGFEAFYKWVGKNLRYPANARRMGLEGKVFLKFIIEPTGKITNVEVVKGFNGECDKEAQRVISIAPNWKPGTLRGRPVRQAYTLPIAFMLAEGRWETKRTKIGQVITPIN
jgi:TonB family protein